MAVKSLLLHLGEAEDSAKEVQAAVALAGRFNAHLIGLYITPEPVYPAFVMGQMPHGALEQQKEALKDRGEDSIAAFRKACDKAGVSSEVREARAFLEDVPAVVGQHGRYADMLVLSQHNPDSPRPGGGSLLEQTVLTCGAPALVVPYIGAPENYGRKAMLAWDGSREAARAVKDAMPFLEAADKVTVLCINPKSDVSGSSHEPGADIAHFLARHGVKAEAKHVNSRDVSIGETLLSRMADEGSDLLVMGAYGHSRLSELILGGVTRTILEHMTVPVLMSH